jgi:hypothetical protein
MKVSEEILPEGQELVGSGKWPVLSNQVAGFSIPHKLPMPSHS